MTDIAFGFDSRTDDSGETVLGHVGNAAQLLVMLGQMADFMSDAEVLELIAGCRARLDKAEAMLTKESAQ